METNRRIYEELLQKIKALSIGSTLQANNSTTLDRAMPATKPFQPVLSRNILAGSMSGLFFGTLLIVLGEFVNRSLKAPGEAPFHLGIPELGVIPSHNNVLDGATERRIRSCFRWPRVGGRPAESASSRVELITWEDRPSVIAEAYRSALASILLSATGAGRPHVIMVTSSGLGEGSSATVSNLGIALAEINHKVILVDADLRKPRLHSIFDVANTWGLSDIFGRNRP